METLMLPIRLRKEPLIDAIFEMRFEGASSVSQVLPGLLFGGLKASNVEAMPASQVPEAIRVNDPLMRFMPVAKVHWDRFMILVGDHAVAIACKLPYPGWAQFKPAIQRVAEIVFSSQLVREVQRCSMKYVDAIEGLSLRDQVAALRWKVEVGGEPLVDGAAQLRVTLQRGPYACYVALATGAELVLADGRPVRGALVDIDLVQSEVPRAPSDFLASLPAISEDIHTANKALFFECLTADTVKNLDPEYAH